MTKIKELADRAFIAQQELEDAEYALAQALSSKHVTLAVDCVVIDHIPPGATVETVETVDGREFDAYEAVIDGVKLVCYSGYREVIDETIPDQSTN